METMNFGESQANSAESSTDQDNNSAPKAPMNKNEKLIWAGIIMAVLILSVVGWQYWQYSNTPYYKQMKAVKEINRQIKESDKWGGKTPEETVALFRDAVKKGDFELASKYGNTEKIKSKLKLLKTDEKINLLIDGLERGILEENMGFGGDSFDLRIKDNDKKYWIMSLYKSEGGTWKIVEF